MPGCFYHSRQTPTDTAAAPTEKRTINTKGRFFIPPLPPAVEMLTGDFGSSHKNKLESFALKLVIHVKTFPRMLSLQNIPRAFFIYKSVRLTSFNMMRLWHQLKHPAAVLASSVLCSSQMQLFTVSLTVKRKSSIKRYNSLSWGYGWCRSSNYFLILSLTYA